MDIGKPIQSTLETFMAQIYSRMVPESKREVNKFYGLSESEISTGSFPAHRISAGQQTERSEQDNRSFAMKLEWPEAIMRFKIGKVHHSASMNEVEKINSQLASAGRRWLKKENKPSLFLSGNPGSGKTFFCFSLLREIAEQGHHKALIIFTRSDDMDNELLNKNEDDVIEKYSEVPFLFIDDLGTERISDRVIKQYYKIFDKRFNDLLTTVITSNVLLENIHTTLGDRIASRLGNCVEIKFPKKDLRKG